ncbi:Uncharacterised protein [Burkholderia pseudomallei]|uniref:hypothetical protein n=1 Tax=Burkholderia pseudomallei TaxID=28450 RepID=UPI000F0792FB|nr:hypothetical protein [Burkholderia pseudomallei]CAJ3846389.1 Uncharacterised protein [Burkholderia pseudomallei]CAJ4295238.1 Uncharacterised protein [Burkholderia pseudomallei]CAJ4318912.1 Uncharacterised protein [Burkholderia pseudomallei]CAJ4324315.1 Uncharacterised protein [Burkholderia pseudomallei]CAJ4502777.1 Uncharacterised protein [Burkholderia pseudomallei]
MTQQQKLMPPSTGAPTTSTTPAIPPAERVPNDTGPESSTTTSACAPGATDIAQTIKKTFRDNVEPAKGVVIVTCTDPSILTVAVAAVANGIHADNTIADLPIAPVSAITFLHSYGSPEAESVKSYAREHIQAGKLKMEPIDHCRRFDPLSPEGVHLVMRHVKPGTCVFATVNYRDLKRDDAIAALAEINAEAEKLGVLIVIYVLHTKKQDMTGFCACCKACVEVSYCEPGPGAQIAILLENLTLTNWHQQGIGRVMIEARLESDGNWTFARERFIAARAIIRVAWYLRAKGTTIERIAEVIGINKSNVSRGLESSLIMPENTVGLVPPTGWAKRWAGRYNFDGVLSRKASRKSTDASPADETANDPVTAKVDDVGPIAKDAFAPDRAHRAAPSSQQ